MILKLLGIHVTGVDATFDGLAILLIILGIATRFALEWYKSATKGDAINWKEQGISSLLALLAYVIVVLMNQVKLDPFDALIMGLAPQTVINEFNKMREAKRIASIIPMKKEGE